VQLKEGSINTLEPCILERRNQSIIDESSNRVGNNSRVNARVARFGVRVQLLYSPEKRVFNFHAKRWEGCRHVCEVCSKRGDV
jgi:hypothetical protein